ncbi:protein-disulfide isomerase [Salana multivorans]|uniref:Protein-disulfide isomerase n=1 Tax=Salana multivorans TaxID=120377 RepID=A0A3N2DA56_9MICO|nr:DsbA family protein [Salana multivorans]ROR96603.1 protein-disulfide isomerase [Salana multivorans]
MSSAPAPRRTSSTATWLVPAVVVLVAAILIAIVVALQDGKPDAGADSAGQSAPDAAATEPGAGDPAAGAPTPDADGVSLAEVERRDENDVLALGPVDAPVVLTVFSDYQCGYCARWSEETFPVVLRYVNAGDLRIEWRDVNIFGANSERAARATYAAALQGALVEYHDALFPGGHTRSEAELSDTALVALASELGLDADRFAIDLSSPAAATEIARNADLGLRLGAYSTPTFVLAGQPIVGAQPTDVFVAAVESAITGATGRAAQQADPTGPADSLTEG